MSQKTSVLVVIILLLVLVIGGSGYFLYSGGYINQLMPQPQTNQNTDIFNYGSTTSGNVNPSGTTGSDEVGNVTSGKIKLVIAYPINGATLSSTSVTVIGKTSPGADVFVNDQETKADSNGNFSLKMTLDEGQNGLVVTANDANGNVVEQDLSVNVQTFN